jgi:hypothetical protein
MYLEFTTTAAAAATTTTTALSAHNTFQDLPRLRETVDNTEHYML